MKPFVGCPVVLVPGPYNQHLFANGHGPEDPIAAIVTRVWNDDMVNLVVFPDHGAMQVCGSVNSKVWEEQQATGQPIERAYWMHLDYAEALVSQPLDEQLQEQPAS